MNNLRKIVDDFITSDFLNNFKNNEYLLADTRIPHVTLYDHSILTSGIAVATAKELLLRGKSVEEICGQTIEDRYLIALVRFASLIHDLGKSESKTEKGYYAHVKHSLNISEKILHKYGIIEPYFSLIQDSIAHHQLRDNPKTLLQKIICLADSLASAGDMPELAKAKTREDFLKVLRGNDELYNVVFESKKGIAVVLGDVDRVHSYVFETSRLPEIRGGSELLNYLNYDWLEELFETELAKECLIYNGGGSFLAMVPEKMADSIIEKIEKEYLDKTGIATITCTKKEVDYLQFARGIAPYANEDIKNLRGEGIGNWLIKSHFGKDQSKWFGVKKINGEECEICNKKGFGEFVAPLSVELRMKKDMKTEVPFYEALPIGRRCNSCGKRMVTNVGNYPDTEEEIHLCDICSIKRKKSRESRFLKRFIDWSWNIKKLDLKGISEKRPENLDKLTEKHGNYYAFIYADGNNIGALLEEIKTPAQYRHFADKLKDAIEYSVFQALFETFVKEIKELEKLPFEIINIGGDDVTVIVAKPFAFMFSQSLLRNFEEETKKIAGEFEKENLHNLTLSLGMAICKATYPVYFAEKISESLLKEAKKRAKEEQQLKSAISYIYLTTDIASESGKALLEMYLEKKDANLSLTMRPYTIEDFDFILKQVQEIQKEKLLAATQRKAFQQALANGRWEAFNFIFYQITRMPEYKRGKLINIVKELSDRFGCDESYLWKLKIDSDRIVYSTPLYDLLELVEVGGELFE